jgi:hypothetical protein
MATILLQAAGTILGGFLGPIGAAIGRAAGALAGYAIDRALITGTQRIEGPRLNSVRAFSAEEGVPIARLYGTARLGGTLIWATRFEEGANTRRQGFKGGPKVTEYAYYGNVAFALCEGEIAGIRRVWADGREVDRTTLEMRVYTGTEEQEPDPLIEAKQGAGNAPAYRGLAYVVLERFALGDYGNRVPQFQFEVMRPIGRLRHWLRAVALIPGATEYGLSPQLVTREKRRGETVAENRHVLHAATDLMASLDELQMLCPAVESVALVVTWFGDDLRAGACRIRPAVTTADRPGLSQPWIVSGLDRATAMVVSTSGGGSAFGGTPSDATVIAAISEIRQRGLKVVLYPFVMMDIPAANALPDPYGGTAQAAYPWRGRITCDPAPDRPGTADKTAAARTQVEAFEGTALATQFSTTDGAVAFTGSAGDWGYRRFVLHYAHLAVAAGGVDGFLLGSELRGLTTLRDGAGAFPFVETLCDLADAVRGLLGPAPAITYGADWSEYFGHQPADGSGDVIFHLDPLWARASVTAVGIDNYMPLSDWRDEDRHAGSPDGAVGPYDPDALRAAITGGEGYDWYYASAAARRDRARSPIADGAYGKHWVYRPKDFFGWWSHAHFDRIGGIEQASPTAWVPQGKPIWLTEIGCPAADKGPNQPNVFPDPKSAENASPYFSNEGRSDVAMLRFLEAHAAQWDPDAEDFEPAGNPVSTVYGGRMVDAQNIYAWAWDARPFPAFPQQSDVWADGGNWHRGHWLNGRLEGAELSELVNAILADHGLDPADARHADSTVNAFVVEEPHSARQALEPLIELFDLAVTEKPDGLALRNAGYQAEAPVDAGAMVADEAGAVVETVRFPDHELPAEALLAFRDPFSEYQSATARVLRLGAQGRRQEGFGFSGVMESGQGQALMADWLQRVWSARETVSLSVASYRAGLEPGALIHLPDAADEAFIVTEVEDGLVRRIKARRLDRTPPAPWLAGAMPNARSPQIRAGQPHVLFLDLPSRTATGAPQDQLRIAAWQIPWRSQAVLASPETTGFAARATVPLPADLGTLVTPLAPSSVCGRVHRAGTIEVALFDAEAASVSRLQLLNGANAAAVRSVSGVWEIVQFETADEFAPGLWRLSGLLRGQLGTDDAMAAGAAAGADIVMLNDRVTPAGLLASEIGLPLNWRVGPSGTEFTAQNFAEMSATGGLRARLPLSPVHLRCRPVAGDLALSWIRRGRLDADDWAPSDIPLGEEREEYQVQIAPASGASVRSATVATPAYMYTAAAIAADFGALPPALDVTVRQFSLAAGWGIPATRRFTF